MSAIILVNKEANVSFPGGAGVEVVVCGEGGGV